MDRKIIELQNKIYKLEKEIESEYNKFYTGESESTDETEVAEYTIQLADKITVLKEELDELIKQDTDFYKEKIEKMGGLI